MRSRCLHLTSPLPSIWRWVYCHMCEGIRIPVLCRGYLRVAITTSLPNPTLNIDCARDARIDLARVSAGLRWKNRLRDTSEDVVRPTLLRALDFAVDFYVVVVKVLRSSSNAIFRYRDYRATPPRQKSPLCLAVRYIMGEAVGKDYISPH